MPPFSPTPRSESSVSSLPEQSSKKAPVSRPTPSLQESRPQVRPLKKELADHLKTASELYTRMIPRYKSGLE